MKQHCVSLSQMSPREAGHPVLILDLVAVFPIFPCALLMKELQ